jgi:hypothetical protein
LESFRDIVFDSHDNIGAETMPGKEKPALARARKVTA